MAMFRMLPLVGIITLLVGCDVQENVVQCTTEDQSEWMDEEEFQADRRDEGYEIDEFKVTPGNCYEIYGRDSNGEDVEIYYDPVDGSISAENRGD